MQGLGLAYYGLAIAGVAITALRIIQLAVLSINASACNRMMQKLLDSGDLPRARKLCDAAPGAAYIGAVRALLDACGAESNRGGEGMLREALREAWNHAVVAQQPRLVRLAWLAPLGFAATIGATLVALRGTDPAPWQAYLVPTAAAGLWIASYRKRQRIEQDFRAGLELLLPSAVAYVLKREAGEFALSPAAGEQTPPRTAASSETAAPATTTAKGGRVVPILVGVVTALALAFRVSMSYPSGTVTGEIRASGPPYGDFVIRPADCFLAEDWGFDGVWVVSSLERTSNGHLGFRGGLGLVEDGSSRRAVLESPHGCNGFKCPQWPVQPNHCSVYDLSTQESGWAWRERGHARLDCRFPGGGTLQVDLSFEGCAYVMDTGGDD